MHVGAAGDVAADAVLAVVPARHPAAAQRAVGGDGQIDLGSLRRQIPRSDDVLPGLGSPLDIMLGERAGGRPARRLARRSARAGAHRVLIVGGERFVEASVEPHEVPAGAEGKSVEVDRGRYPATLPAIPMVTAR